MLMIANLIEPCTGKLILNHFTGNNCPHFRKELLDSYFFELTLGSFPNQALSNQSYEHNLVHMPSLNLTPKLSFEHRLRNFIRS